MNKGTQRAPGEHIRMRSEWPCGIWLGEYRELVELQKPGTIRDLSASKFAWQAACCSPHSPTCAISPKVIESGSVREPEWRKRKGKKEYTSCVWLHAGAFDINAQQQFSDNKWGSGKRQLCLIQTSRAKNTNVQQQRLSLEQIVRAMHCFVTVVLKAHLVKTGEENSPLDFGPLPRVRSTGHYCWSTHISD